MDRRVRHGNEYPELVTPDLPPNFPRAIPQDVDFQQRLRELPEPSIDSANLIDVGWSPENNVRLGNSCNVRVANLFDQGALFIFGPNARTSTQTPRYRRYVVGARFALNDAETVNRSIMQALSEGLITSAAIVLPDTPEIQASYGRELMHRIQERLALRDDQISLSYSTYDRIVPERPQIPVESVTASWESYTIRHKWTSIRGPDSGLFPTSPTPIPEQEAQSSSRHSALIAAIEDIEQMDIDPNLEVDDTDGQVQFPQPPLDVPSLIPPIIPSSGPESQIPRDTDAVGRLTNEDVKRSEGRNIGVFDLINEGALFIYGRRSDNNRRYITGAKFSLEQSIAFDMAIQQSSLHEASVDRIRLVLPNTLDAISRYYTELTEYILSIMKDRPTIETEYYSFNEQNAHNPSLACSYTANFNDYTLQSRWYRVIPVVGVQPPALPIIV